MTFGISAATAISAVGAGAAVYSASQSGKASSSAAGAQQAAAGMSIDEQRRQYDQTRADQAPFVRTGTAANNRLADLLGVGQTSYTLQDFRNSPYVSSQTGKSAENLDTQSQWLMNAYNAASDEEKKNLAKTYGLSDLADTSASDYGSLLKKFSADDLAADPVYQSGLQFGLDQGTGAINARAQQVGSYDSGATLKALTRYANDYGSTKANESYNRYNTTNDSIYNKLAGVSNAGQSATNQVQAAGTSAANSISGSLTDSGNARASGIVGGANAWGTGLSGLSSAYNNYNNSQTLKSLLAGNTTDPYAWSSQQSDLNNAALWSE